jgi:hypothetical protein
VSRESLIDDIVRDGARGYAVLREQAARHPRVRTDDVV